MITRTFFKTYSDDDGDGGGCYGDGGDDDLLMSCCFDDNDNDDYGHCHGCCNCNDYNNNNVDIDDDCTYACAYTCLFCDCFYFLEELPLSCCWGYNNYCNGLDTCGPCEC